MARGNLLITFGLLGLGTLGLHRCAQQVSPLENEVGVILNRDRLDSFDCRDYTLKFWEDGRLEVYEVDRLLCTSAVPRLGIYSDLSCPEDLDLDTLYIELEECLEAYK